MSAELEQAIADLRAIGARFSPEARVGADLVNPMTFAPDPVMPAHAPMVMEPDYVGPQNPTQQAPGLNPGVVAMQQPGGMLAPAQPQIHNPALMGFGDPDMAPAPGPRPDVAVAPSQLSPSMQAGMAAADAAPEDPYAAGAPGAPLPLPKTADEADAQLQAGVAQHGDALARQDAAEFDAEKQRAQGKADLLRKGADDQALVFAQHQTDLKNVEARNDLEAANYIQELSDLAKKEPNPHRYWENSSGLAKALWALGLVAGSGYAALTPGGQNAALAMFRQEVASDVAQQDARLKREMAVKQLEGRYMDRRHDRNLSDERDSYAQKLTRLQALERAAIAQNDIPGDLDAAARKARMQAIIAQEKLPLLQERLNNKNAQARDALNRQHAEQMQRAQFAHAKEMAEYDRQTRLMLAPVQVSGSMSTGLGSKRNPIDPKTGEPMYRELGSGMGTGVVLAGPDGKPAQGDGVMLFRKEDKEEWTKAGTVISAANATYTARKRLRDYLAAMPSSERALNVLTGPTTPQVNALIEEAGYGKASEQNKIVTDKDKSSGVQQVIGFDPNGNWLQRGKFALSIDKVIGKIDEDLGAMDKVVNNQIRPVNAPELNGQGTHLVWSPEYLQPDQPQERSAREVEGKPNVTFKEAPLGLGGEGAIKDYEERARIELTDPPRRGSLLPEHEAGPVQDLIRAAKGRGPDGVEAEAGRILDKLQKRQDALVAKTSYETEYPGSPKVTKPARDMTPEEQKAYQTLEDTKTAVKAVAEDAKAQAVKTLEKFENKLVAQPWMLDKGGDYARGIARKPGTGLGLAPDDVEQAIRNARKRIAEPKGPKDTGSKVSDYGEYLQDTYGKPEED